GHILTVNGITVEILECPEVAAKNREITQFLDLKDFTNPIPVESSMAAAPIPAIDYQDPPDKVVLPISLIKPEERHSAPKARGTLSKVAAFAAKAKKDISDPEDQIHRRQRNLQKAAVVACMFAGLIVGAHQLSQKYYFSFDEDEQSTTAEVAELPARARPVSRSLASVETESIPATEAQAVEPPAEQEAIPASSVTLMTETAKVLPSEAKVGRNGMEKELISAIEEGNLKLVTKLIEVDGVSADFTLDELGRAPFLRAAASGRVAVMEYLLSKKVTSHAVDFHGNDALMWAAINGHEKTANFLLARGFRPNVKREDGKTALVLARNYHQAPIEKVLLAVSKPREKKAHVPASVQESN
ncbi:MAG: ankyrin repeat domain-containing protein, partial [Bdellovibrionota bacterium]